jgi:ABC-type lipoprotein release transport system permease subunit
MITKLALRNILGSGVRTWLNILVLSFALVAIVWMQGFVVGMDEQATDALVNAEYGGGQYWHELYDPYDPLSLQDAHGILPPSINELVIDGQAAPILITQGTLYIEGRIRPVLLKGIDPEQSILSIPSSFLVGYSDELPALIGARMAKSADLKIGDYITIQWRDTHGTFDAQDARIVQIMSTSVQSIDNNQIWFPLDRLRAMLETPHEATLVVIDKDVEEQTVLAGWIFKDLDFLLQDIRELVKRKTIGSSIFYVMLLFLAMVAIFDTQILSVFRRKKEMGTLMALGMTRFKVIQLFTLEGALHGVFAVAIGMIYGFPLCYYFAKWGWPMLEIYDSFGFAMGEALFPVYSLALIVGSTLLVLTVTVIVSFLPTRRIAKLKPTDALRGSLT